MKLLTDEFLAPYKQKDVPFGPLGYITYKRTYARFIEAENRTEEWWETCARVLEGNFGLEIKTFTGHLSLGPFTERMNALRQEAQQAYDDMFNLYWLPAGRSLWMSGTETAQRNGAALTNCYFVEVKLGGIKNKVSYPFEFAMDMLMLGAGVGFGVSESSIGGLPSVCNPVNLHIVCREDHRDYQFLNADKIPLETHQYIVVKDSREGWTYALRKVIDGAFLSKRGNTKSLVIDVGSIRPCGERITGFGGKSSGPAPLVSLLRDVNSILNGTIGRKLSEVSVTDMMTLIGRCVVSGNVRRSAMIAIGDAGSQEFINMKNPIPDDDDSWWYRFSENENHNKRIMSHRWASNNSVLVGEGFNSDEIAESIWVKGEPGFINLERMRNYGRTIDGRIEGCDGGVSGTNPCGEISLESYEPCNLSEIFPSNCPDFETIKRVSITAYRYAKRITLSQYQWPETSDVVSRNRRIGVSISGIQDWHLKEKCKLDFMLDTLYKLIKSHDQAFSEQLGIPESIKLTTVKPSGTISLLAGVSPGVHYPYSAFYIRRIQFQDTDPIVSQLKEYGFNVHKAAQTPNAMVVEFPIKSKYADHPGFKSAGQVNALTQLEYQDMLQTYWADNQVSCTISLQESDKLVLPELIHEYSQKLKSTSFLPYTPALKDHYPDLPYEPIEESEYEYLMSQIKEWPTRFNADGINREKNELHEIIDQDECKGGACPIK